MTPAQAFALAGVVLAMVCGQLLFKLSSSRVQLDGGAMKLFLSLANWQFILALAVYGIGTILWVIVIKSVPLNRAYPFMALSFAIMPVAAFFLFKEPISLRYVAGMLLLLGGLLVIASE